MKTSSFLSCIAITCAMILNSCSNKENDNEGLGNLIPMTFTASAEADGGSRSALAANGVSVNWVTDDAISVFDFNNANNAFTLSEGAGTNVGHFDGTLTNATLQNTALYPYFQNATIAERTISGILMPAEQKAVKNGFDPTSNIMTAFSTDGKFYFKQAVCYVKITTTDECDKIVFTANGNESLAGTTNLNVGEKGIPTHTVTANGATTVTLMPTEGLTSFEAGTYHIGILPQTLASGFTVECFKTNSEMKQVKKYDKSISIFSRGKIVNLGSTNGWEEKDKHVCQHYYEYGKGAKEYVDLGLPSGTLWATTNLGAMEPWEYGDYYQWGATAPQLLSYDQEDNKAWVTHGTGKCQWATELKENTYRNAPFHLANNINEGEGPYWTKYAPSTTFQAPGANPEDLAKMVLDPEDDAATYQWGYEWRMPTKEEILELKNNTYWLHTINYKSSGIEGYIVYKVKDASHKNRVFIKGTGYDYSSQYDINDPHIFLPLAGVISNLIPGNPITYIRDTDYVNGNYLTSNLFADWACQYSAFARCGSKSSTDFNIPTHTGRGVGMSIRPVFHLTNKQLGNP